MKQWLLFLLTIGFTSAEAQTEFAPVGAEWHFRYLFYWTGTDAYASAKCEKDTLMDGHLCKKVCLSRITHENAAKKCDEIQYFYQSKDSIFRYKPDGKPTSTLIFRNDLKVGEYFQTEHSYPFRVVAVDTFYFQDRATRWFELRDSIYEEHIRYISDTFGPATGFFDPYMGMLADYHEYYLRCYTDPSFPLLNITSVDCELILTPTRSLYEVLVVPNPAHDYLDMYFDGWWPSEYMQVNVWDALGRLVLSEKLGAGSKTLNVQSLSSGFYHLVVQSGNAIVQQKFIKN